MEKMFYTIEKVITMCIMKIDINSAIIFDSEIFEEEFTVENTKEISLKPGINQTFIFWRPKGSTRKVKITSVDFDEVRKYIQQKKSVL